MGTGSAGHLHDATARPDSYSAGLEPSETATRSPVRSAERPVSATTVAA